MSTVREVTAAEVREFYRTDPKRVARLSEAAARTVAPGARGRLHPEVEQDHNKRRRGVVYVLGPNTRDAQKARTEARAALVAKGLAGRRGPLSAKAKETLAQSKG